jgi:hypothetical protein
MPVNAVNLDTDHERANGPLPEAEAAPIPGFTPEVQATIDTLLAHQLHETEARLRQAADFERRAMVTKHAKQLVDMCGQTRETQLYATAPCLGLKYPGPGKTASQYKNYLTLIGGELGLNPVLETYTERRIPHPISADSRLTTRIQHHYHTTLHQTGWVFDETKTGYTITEIERNDPDLAGDMRNAMNKHTGRRPGESYAQLNKTLFMAIHRTMDAVVRDYDLVGSVEDGTYSHTWDGVGLLKAIQTLALGEHGDDTAALRKEKLLTLQSTPYVASKTGIREMFRKITKARTELRR